MEDPVDPKESREEEDPMVDGSFGCMGVGGARDNVSSLVGAAGRAGTENCQSLPFCDINGSTSMAA